MSDYKHPTKHEQACLQGKYSEDRDSEAERRQREREKEWE